MEKESVDELSYMGFKEVSKAQQRLGKPRQVSLLLSKDADKKPIIEGGSLTPTDTLKQTLSETPSTQPDTTADDMVYLAKAAEQAERYEGLSYPQIPLC